MLLSILLEMAAFNVFQHYAWLFVGAVLAASSFIVAEIAYFTAFAHSFRGGELAFAFALEYGAPAACFLEATKTASQSMCH